MISRRFLVATPALLLAPGSQAQGSGSGFVGTWQGQVQGVGDVRLIVTGVKIDGQVEGRMEFTLQSFVSTFGDKVDMAWYRGRIFASSRRWVASTNLDVTAIG